MFNKEAFEIVIVERKECKKLLEQFHYLSKAGNGFKSGINFGLRYNNKVMGVCIFTPLPVPEVVRGMFGLERWQQDGIFELSRLCLSSNLQWVKGENISSWFVSQCLRIMKKKHKARAILSYADADHHKGTIYQALNFKYYGLSELKKDFWFEYSDGTFVKHVRGPTKGFKGEWRPRTQKHRYLIIYDKKLKCLWVEQKYPK